MIESDLTILNLKKILLNFDYYFLISERLNIMINKYIESILTRDKIEALAGQVPRSRPITFYDVSNPYPQSSGQLFIKERYTFLTFLKMFIINNHIKNTIYCFPERMSMNGLLFSG